MRQEGSSHQSGHHAPFLVTPPPSPISGPSRVPAAGGPQQMLYLQGSENHTGAEKLSSFSTCRGQGLPTLHRVSNPNVYVFLYLVVKRKEAWGIVMLIFCWRNIEVTLNCIKLKLSNPLNLKNIFSEFSIRSFHSLVRSSFWNLRTIFCDAGLLYLTYCIWYYI